jgi:hypothetical protein
MHRDACGLADELVVRRFIGVLKASPTADVVHKNCSEFVLPADNILQQLFQSGSIFSLNPLLAGSG